MPDLRQLLLQRELAVMGEPLLPREKSYRSDASLKGHGFLGALPVPGGEMSEFSIATDKFGGKDFPTIVPTLTAAELNQVMNQKISPAVQNKAELHALLRQRAGEPLFAQEGEQNYDVLPMFRRIK